MIQRNCARMLPSSLLPWPWSLELEVFWNRAEFASLFVDNNSTRLSIWKIFNLNCRISKLWTKLGNLLMKKSYWTLNSSQTSKFFTLLTSTWILTILRKPQQFATCRSVVILKMVTQKLNQCKPNPLAALSAIPRSSSLTKPLTIFKKTLNKLILSSWLATTQRTMNGKRPLRQWSMLGNLFRARLLRKWTQSISSQHQETINTCQTIKLIHHLYLNKVWRSTEYILLMNNRM